MWDILCHSVFCCLFAFGFQTTKQIILYAFGETNKMKFDINWINISFCDVEQLDDDAWKCGFLGDSSGSLSKFVKMFKLQFFLLFQVSSLIHLN